MGLRYFISVVSRVSGHFDRCPRQRRACFQAFKLPADISRSPSRYAMLKSLHARNYCRQSPDISFRRHSRIHIGYRFFEMPRQAARSRHQPPLSLWAPPLSRPDVRCQRRLRPKATTPGKGQHLENYFSPSLFRRLLLCLHAPAWPATPPSFSRATCRADAAYVQSAGAIV